MERQNEFLYGNKRHAQTETNKWKLEMLSNLDSTLPEMWATELSGSGWPSVGPLNNCAVTRAVSLYKVKD